MKLQVKVCGMRSSDNLNELLTNAIEYVGFVFHKQSARFISSPIFSKNGNAKRVGVFVNEKAAEILKIKQDHGLDLIQLHGNESPELCAALRLHIPIIKTILMSDKSDLAKTKEYESVCDYFLFDTAGQYPGGNGIKFDWQLLEHYEGKIPFFLSGGICSEDISRIQHLRHPCLHAIDINSRFEISPGIKNSLLIKKFIHELRAN
jgi:phosphoribosylanthranilate isomerase